MKGFILAAFVAFSAIQLNAQVSSFSGQSYCTHNDYIRYQMNQMANNDYMAASGQYRVCTPEMTGRNSGYQIQGNISYTRGPLSGSVNGSYNSGQNYETRQ